MKSPLFLFIFLCTFLTNTQQLTAQTIKDSLKFYNKKINRPKEKNDLIEGYRFYNRYKEFSFKEKDTIQAVYGLAQIALAEKRMGLYNEAELSAVDALKWLELINDISEKSYSRYSAWLYNHIAGIYILDGNLDKALNYYNKSLSIAKTKKDSLRVKNNTANIYLEQGKVDKAIDAYRFLYSQSLNNGSKVKSARYLFNLGRAQLFVDAKTGLQNIKNAISIYEKENYIIGVYECYKILAEHYIKLDKVKAKNYADKAYSISEQLNIDAYRADALTNLIKLHSDPKVVEYQQINDSLIESRANLRNKFSAIKYEEQKYKQESQALIIKSEKEKAERIKYQLIASWAIVGFLVLVVFFVYRNYKNKQKNTLIAFKTESKISRKIHDVVANDIYKIMLDLEGVVDTGIVDQLEGIYHKTRDIARENATINTDTEYKQLLIDLLVGYKSINTQVITKSISDIPWDKLSDLKKRSLYRVLQELMTNMKKHSQATLVVLNFSQVGNRLHIKYTDNGVGCTIKKQVGLQNIEDRIATAGGLVNFDSSPEKGFIAKIVL